MVPLIIISLIVIWMIWNVTLIGYRDKPRQTAVPQVDEVFDPRCLPVILEHDEKSNKAIIMIHGLPSTPYAYDYAAKKAFEEGYDIFVPLLPGFGTKPEHLENTTYSQWFAYMKEYYLDKRSQYEKLYVIGTSMGGAMTLHLAETFTKEAQRPDAVCTIAAPVFLNNISEGVVKNWLYYFARTVALFTASIKTGIHYGKEEENDGDELWIGYKGVFVRVGVSFLSALKKIKRNLSSINVPIFMLHDHNDRTVPSVNLEYIYKHISSTEKEYEITHMDKDHNRHVLLMYKSVQQQLLEKILSFFENH
ncbi:MAG: alpha/beta fold hydrolase [Sphaerochaetaceae bacterium]|nr:alpha/beta fold hydrolase [Sphaerochaetaceae bacterium]